MDNKEIEKDILYMAFYQSINDIEFYENELKQVPNSPHLRRRLDYKKELNAEIQKRILQYEKM